jgi:hypothetical protein
MARVSYPPVKAGHLLIDGTDLRISELSVSAMQNVDNGT